MIFYLFLSQTKWPFEYEKPKNERVKADRLSDFHTYIFSANSDILYFYNSHNIETCRNFKIGLDGGTFVFAKKINFLYRTDILTLLTLLLLLLLLFSIFCIIIIIIIQL